MGIGKLKYLEFSVRTELEIRHRLILHTWFLYDTASSASNGIDARDSNGCTRKRSHLKKVSSFHIA